MTVPQAPEQNLAESLVVSPATAVVTWFDTRSLNRILGGGLGEVLVFSLKHLVWMCRAYVVIRAGKQWNSPSDFEECF